MSEKKRSLDSEKKRGYRIIAYVERIEEVDLGENDPEVVIIYKKTIGTISGACNLNVKKNATTITLDGVNNIVLKPDPSVKLHVGTMLGGGSVKMKI